jgi:phosphoserine phosphatase
MEIYIATSSNMTADEYQTLAREWLDESFHPHFGLPYTECVYTPMLELLSYLKAEGFKVYIVTGGDQDFVRAFSWEVYGIPPEQVIGSAIKHQFIEVDGNSSVVKLPEIQVVNDGRVKAEQIQLIVGLRPILAYGNSDGDIPMLKFATGGRVPPGLAEPSRRSIREYAMITVRHRKAGGGLSWRKNGVGGVSKKEDWNCNFYRVPFYFFSEYAICKAEAMGF